MNSQIVWCNGPFKGSVPDLTIARQDLVHLLNEGEGLLADKGYIGEECFITPYKPAKNNYEKEFNRQANKQRQIIERIITRIEIFHSVKKEWRHDISLHYFIFYVIANITNLNLMERPLNK